MLHFFKLSLGAEKYYYFIPHLKKAALCVVSKSLQVLEPHSNSVSLNLYRKPQDSQALDVFQEYYSDDRILLLFSD